MLGQLLFSGLAQGALYALFALAMTAVFRATTVVNFGHGDLLMAGAFVVYVLVVLLHVNFALSAVIAVGVLFAAGVAIERWFIRPILGGPHLSLAMMALIEPGDEVLYPDPGFPIYPSFTRGLGAQAVPFGLREGRQFQPDMQEISSKITARTRVLIFNSPNNPTGTVFHREELERIASLAQEHDLWVITDEIYARILFGGEYQSIWALPGMSVCLNDVQSSIVFQPAI